MDGMKRRLRILDDEEFKKELDDMLAKPKEWWIERAERAIRGGRVNTRKNKKASRGH